FQASSAKRTFWVAVAQVKGGKGGRLVGSMDMAFSLGGCCVVSSGTSDRGATVGGRMCEGAPHRSTAAMEDDRILHGQSYQTVGACGEWTTQWGGMRL